MFKCKLCEEKDNRINDHKNEIDRLVSQVELFRKLAFPEERKTSTPQEVEFNRIFNDSSEDSYRTELEAHNLLTGSAGDN